MLWEMNNELLLTSFAFICCFSFICGWVSDRILGYAGFSVVGNWLLLMMGAYVGLFVYNLMGHRFDWNSHITMMLAFGSALALLFTMLSVKTILHVR